jgi:predicted alpha/beta-fold hydrolase
VNGYLEVRFVPQGGHVGFVSGPPWRQTYWAEACAFDFLARRIEERRANTHLPPVSGGVR